MVMMPSQMIPLGTPAPDFALPDVTTGKTVTLDDVAGEKGFLVMFICRHCYNHIWKAPKVCKIIIT